MIRALLMLVLLISIPAIAQDHAHPPQDAQLHVQFYAEWNIPNNGEVRVSSCCNQTDCAPADTKFERGHWWGRRRIDPDWIMIPDGILESNQGDPRESPDGASHLCVHPGNGRVLCAVLGGGT